MDRAGKKKEYNRAWRAKNKQRVADYNRFYREQEPKEKKTLPIQIRKKGSSDEWITYPTQLAAAKAEGLTPPNLNKVVKGELGSTGGYEARYVPEKSTPPVATSATPSQWVEVRTEFGYSNASEGPSKKRTPHTIVDGTIGKKCCTCKEWRPLIEFNRLTSHWDGLRIDCKACLITYRRDPANKKRHTEFMTEYARERQSRDEAFRQAKALRSTLSGILNAIKAGRSQHPRCSDLVSCTMADLKEQIETRFQSGMTWGNYGTVWHIDHCIPCTAFDMSKEFDRNVCFHYSNLQPLTPAQNCTKGNNYEESDRQALIDRVHTFVEAK